MGHMAIGQAPESVVAKFLLATYSRNVPARGSLDSLPLSRGFQFCIVAYPAKIGGETDQQASAAVK